MYEQLAAKQHAATGGWELLPPPREGFLNYSHILSQTKPIFSKIGTSFPAELRQQILLEFFQSHEFCSVDGVRAVRVVRHKILPQLYRAAPMDLTDVWLQFVWHRLTELEADLTQWGFRNTILERVRWCDLLRINSLRYVYFLCERKRRYAGNRSLGTMDEDIRAAVSHGLVNDAELAIGRCEDALATFRLAHMGLTALDTWGGWIDRSGRIAYAATEMGKAAWEMEGRLWQESKEVGEKFVNVFTPPQRASR